MQRLAVDQDQKLVVAVAIPVGHRPQTGAPRDRKRIAAASEEQADFAVLDRDELRLAVAVAP